MKVAIVLNSPSINREIEEDVVIAADAGYLHAKNQRKNIEIIIGDFDSSNKPKNEMLKCLNPVKNDTDGQACIDYAYEKGYKDISIYGIAGGRVDHILCNLSLLVQAKKKGIRAIGKEDNYDIYYLEEGKYTFNTSKGKEFSTILFSDYAILDNGQNMQYPINNLKITKDNLGLGISNVALEDEISFEVVEGSIFLFLYK